jgi:hypothetical protein
VTETPNRKFYERIRALVEPVGGIDLDLPPREPVRDPPRSDIGKTVLDVYDLRRTCIACPSQWEGRINDDRSIYIRYRWGELTVRVSMSDANAVRAETCLYEDDIGLRTGDCLGGYMDTGEMCEALAHVCHFNGECNEEYWHSHL